MNSVQFSRQRAAAILFLAASIATSWGGLLPYVVYRVPLALIAAWGLWRHSRWGLILALLAAYVWLLVSIELVAYLAQPPGVPWPVWLAWIGPLLLVFGAVAVLGSVSGRDEPQNESQFIRKNTVV